MIDCCKDSENIDLKEPFQRAKVHEGIQKRTNEASAKNHQPQEIARTSLREKYALKEKPKHESVAQQIQASIRIGSSTQQL